MEKLHVQAMIEFAIQNHIRSAILLYKEGFWPQSRFWSMQTLEHFGIAILIHNGVEDIHSYRNKINEIYQKIQSIYGDSFDESDAHMARYMQMTNMLANLVDINDDEEEAIYYPSNKFQAKEALNWAVDMINNMPEQLVSVEKKEAINASIEQIK